MTLLRGLITVQTPYAGSPAAADLLAFPALADLVAKALELLIGLPPGDGKRQGGYCKQALVCVDRRNESTRLHEHSP